MGNEDSRRDAPVGQLARVWSTLAIASLLAGLVLTLHPDFASLGSTVVTLIPFLLLGIIGVAAVSLPERGPASTLTTIVAIVGWAILIIDGDSGDDTAECVGNLNGDVTTAPDAQRTRTWSPDRTRP